MVNAALAAGDTDLASKLLKLSPAFYEIASAVEAVFDSISQTTAQSVRDIEMSVLSDREKYIYLDTEIENYIDKLSSATLPSEIENLFNKINSDITAAYGLLSEDEQRRLAPQFIDRLYEAESIAQARLSVAEEESDTADTYLEAAQETKEAAAEQKAAAEEFTVAARLTLAASEKIAETFTRFISTNSSVANSRGQVNFS
jgi:hypothetical protein